ncbi:hypothetical protein HK104_010818 [Borealophlyctis nickersoniae]|nr:hypothetical protein HK104_010818 [Borealophlyctis nickersoniae]
MTNDTTSTTTGALQVAGGAAINRSAFVGSTTAGATIKLTSGTQSAYYYSYNNAQSTNYFYWGSNYNGSNYAFVLYNQANTGVYLSSGATAWTANSDERLKRDITAIDDSTSLSQVLQLRPVSYLWKADPDETKKKLGLIAQEVEPIIPEVVTEGPDKYLGVNYTDLIPMLIGSVKSLAARLDKLEQ